MTRYCHHNWIEVSRSHGVYVFTRAGARYYKVTIGEICTKCRATRTRKEYEVR